jgi:hypothetical protein
MVGQVPACRRLTPKFPVPFQDWSLGDIQALFQEQSPAQSPVLFQARLQHIPQAHIQVWPLACIQA